MCKKDVVHFVPCLGIRKKVKADGHPHPTSTLRPDPSILPDTLVFRKCVLTPGSDLSKPDTDQTAWVCFHFDLRVPPSPLSSLAVTGSVSGDPATIQMVFP